MNPNQSIKQNQMHFTKVDLNIENVTSSFPKMWLAKQSSKYTLNVEVYKTMCMISWLQT